MGLEPCWFTLELEIPNTPKMLGMVASAIGNGGGNIGPIDIIRIDPQSIVRRIAISVENEIDLPEILANIRAISGVNIITVVDPVTSVHIGGKIQVVPRYAICNEADLARAYTPGVARVCRLIAEDPEEAWRFTMKGNSVAIITDGSRVLGLGNLSAAASLPVMEGKAVIFKWRANINAIPIPLGTQDAREIIKIVQSVQPAFGAINLEDIASPKCFGIEDELASTMEIPVMHDDQHATAIAVLAGLFNALKIVGKDLKQVKIVICGAGAAGTATAQLLIAAGAKNILCVDKFGIIYKGISHPLHRGQAWIAENTNTDRIKGELKDAMKKSDVFIGLSMPGILTVEMLQKMSADSIVFALANPVPEIDPHEASLHSAVIAVGRSGFPYFNFINNALVFPGFFRGLLDARIKKITNSMKLSAATALAGLVQSEDLAQKKIIPSIFDDNIVPAIASAVIAAAQEDKATNTA